MITVEELLNYKYPIYYVYWIRCIHRPEHRGYIGARKSKTDNIHKDWYWGSSRNKEFKDDFKKYGVEGFTKSILSWSYEKERIKNLEAICIEIGNTLIPNGYNIHPLGGGSIHGWSKDFNDHRSIKEKLINKYGVDIGEEKWKVLRETNSDRINKLSRRSPFVVWVEKYGEEEAQKMKEDFYKNRKKRKGLVKEWIEKNGEDWARERVKLAAEKVSATKQQQKADGIKRKSRKPGSKTNDRKCVVMGVEYKSIMDASRQTGFKWDKISYMIHRNKNNSYYIDKNL